MQKFPVRLRRGAQPLLWLLLGWMVTAAGMAEEVRVPVRGERAPIDVGPYLSIYRDAGGTLSLEQVTAAFRAGAFVRNPQPRPNLGYTADAVWVRLALRSELASSQKRLLELQTTRQDYVDWYICGDGQLLHHVATGIRRLPSASGVTYRYPTLTLDLQPGQDVEIFLRVQTETAMILPLTLWTSEAYMREVTLRELGQGVLFGHLLGLILMGLIFAAFTKDSGYLYYTIAVACEVASFFIQNGHYSNLGLPAAGFWTHNGAMLLNELSLTGVLLFMGYFFALKTDYPRAHRLILWLVWLGLASLPLLAVGPFRPLIQLQQLQSALVSFGLLIPAAVFYYRKVKIARFYLLAWLLFWIMLLVDIFQYHAWLVAWPLGPGTGMQIAFAISSTLFLVAMADKVRQNRLDLLAAQAHALDLQREMTVRLERQVAARTEDLRRAKLAAEQASEAKTRFFSNISHDLRVPLNSLVGLSQSLFLECRGQPLPAEFLTFLEQIHQSGIYLSQLMDNILDLTAIEAGQDHVRCVRFPLRAWFFRCRDIVAPIASQGQTLMHWNCAADDTRVFGSDPVRLSQCLLNLVLNALKHTPRGEPISVELACDDARLVLTVADRGPGIPVAERERIFERFAQLPGDSVQPGRKGVGLGLPIVRHYTEALNGTIQIADRPEGGTVFTISVPNHQEETRA